MGIGLVSLHVSADGAVGQMALGAGAGTACLSALEQATVGIAAAMWWLCVLAVMSEGVGSCWP